MIVRRAEIKDIKYIRKLLSQVLEVHHKGRPDIFKSGVRKYTDMEIESIIADDMRPVFVADKNGEVLGYSFCIVTENKNDNIICDIKTLYIDDLCVDETARGMKIGKTLYEYVLKYAKEIGCYNVTLNVWYCNKSAMGFYEKMGLTPQKIGMEKIL